VNAALAAGGIITFDCGADPVAIALAGARTINKDTSIDGGSSVTLKGDETAPLFSVNAPFALANLTITGGYSAISNNGRNRVVVTNCTFAGNSAPEGGAIFNVDGGELTVTNSTFSSNSSRGLAFGGSDGGAIYNEGTLTVSSCTFVANSAYGADTQDALSFGGAIASRGGTLTVTNCTFVGNSCTGTGGAISSDGPLAVTNSTFVGNYAGGGAVYNSRPGPAGPFTNSIVVNDDCFGIVDGGHNLDSGEGCGFSLTKGSFRNTDPLLDPAGLANNGGPTQTIALRVGSPAINAGDEAACTAPPVNNRDQRGYARPGLGATSCSIGAYEFNSPGTPPPTSTSTASPPSTVTPTTTPSRTRTPTPSITPTRTSTLKPTVTPTNTSRSAATSEPTGTPTEPKPVASFTPTLSATVPPSPTPTASPTSTSRPCAGDCNGSGEVTIGELLKLVNIALGTTQTSTCASGIPSGKQVNVALIVQAVSNALTGCPGAPTLP
jgi:predicted outer membrane repeat protein